MSDNNNLSTLLSKTNIMTPEPSNPSNFADCYKLDRKLMSGSYGTVYVGIDIKRGTPYAVKVVDRR
jgi:serine/threonine protein kinase